MCLHLYICVYIYTYTNLPKTPSCEELDVLESSTTIPCQHAPKWGHLARKIKIKTHHAPLNYFYFPQN